MKVPRWLAPWRKQTDQNTVTPIGPGYQLPSKFGWIVESFGGSWQRNLTLDATENLMQFAAVFACVSLIAGDIAKLGICVLRRDPTTKIWLEAENSPFSKVLKKPNRYQTRFQFILQWVVCKLLWGNTYVLKQRDARGIVEAMYILNPNRVEPLIAPDGEVYYQLGADRLAGVTKEKDVVLASEIIHDRGECIFHPLVGVGPLYAAAMSATQGTRIQRNSATFFENMSRPSGQLTAPGTIKQETADRVKKAFEEGFSGANLGRFFVSGDGLKFEAFSVPAEASQLIEQLGWTGEDVARAFLVPAYKIGLGSAPSMHNIAALNQEYYQQVLQRYIEAIEDLLDDGLSLPSDISAEFDVDDLLRMDPKTRAETREIEVRAALLKPNEGRAAENRPPVKGGDTVYMQQQNYSLEALARRDAKADPFGTGTAPAAPAADPAAAANDEISAEDAAAGKAAVKAALVGDIA